MADLAFSIVPLDFASVPGFGAENMFSRLAGSGAEEMGYPLLTAEDFSAVSSSPALDGASAAAALHEMNPGLPAPPADARYVLGGQQCALLMGPMYAFLKAVTAVSLARKMSEETGETVLPLFWMASEDHDVLEVNRVTVAGQRFVHEYPGPIEHGKVPQVADIDCSGAKAPVIEFLGQALHETEFTPWLMALVEAADWSTYSTAFGGIMAALFNEWDLRLVDPVALRRLSGPVLASLVEDWPKVAAAVGKGKEMLAEASVEAPLSSAGVFEITSSGRVAVEFAPEGASAVISTGEVTVAALADEIRRRPDEFSGSAIIRPVLQDATLPVAATFGGPSEMAYLWQARPLYDVIGAKPSPRLPRISATFVEENILSAARKAGLSLADIFEAPRLLAGPPPVESEGASAIRSQGEVLLAEVDRLIEARDEQSPPKWLRKGRDTIAQSVERIAGKLAGEVLEAEGRAGARLEKIAAAVLPGGKPQERAESAIRSLSLHGPDLVARCIDSLDPLAGAHLVVGISSRRDDD